MKSLQRLLGKIYNTIIILYDRLTAKRCEVSIGDIMLKRAHIDSCQFTAATRLLDVKHYIKTGLNDFPYQNIVSKKMWGEKHEEKRGNSSFEKLIKSYEKNGYNLSLLEVSRTFVLLNGTHRVACNIYFRYDLIRVNRLCRSISINDTPIRQLELNLEPSFVMEVLTEYNNIQDYLIDSGNTFVALLTNEIYGNIEAEIYSLVNVLRVVNFISHNANIGFNGKLIQFSLPVPNYSISKNHEIISYYAYDLSKSYSKRFKENVIISKSCWEGKKLFDSVEIQLDNTLN